MDLNYVYWQGLQTQTWKWMSDLNIFCLKTLWIEHTKTNDGFSKSMQFKKKKKNMFTINLCFNIWTSAYNEEGSLM